MTVSISTVDPAARDQLPGDNVAKEEGKDVGLISYGGVFVEITDGAGEKLNLRPGATATVTIPVPKGILQAGKPLDVLTYSTNATPGKGERGNPDGVWTREGTAQLVGNSYVATVSHFSFVSLGFTLPQSVVHPARRGRDAHELRPGGHHARPGHRHARTPVTQKVTIDNSQLRFHLITGLPRTIRT